MVRVLDSVPSREPVDGCLVGSNLCEIRFSHFLPRSNHRGVLARRWISRCQALARDDEVFFHIASQASRLFVIDLEILATPASLASPAIAFEHLIA